MKYRKKPVVIDAWPVRKILQDAAHDWQALPAEVRAAYETGVFVFVEDALFVKTLEGDHRGEPTDWLIRGVAGEFYCCKPDIFEATYELEGAE